MIPKRVVELENELQKEGKVRCKFYGCHGVKHKMKASKEYMYHIYENRN